MHIQDISSPHLNPILILPSVIGWTPPSLPTSSLPWHLTSSLYPPCRRTLSGYFLAQSTSWNIHETGWKVMPWRPWNVWSHGRRREFYHRTFTTLTPFRKATSMKILQVPFDTSHFISQVEAPPILLEFINYLYLLHPPRLFLSFLYLHLFFFIYLFLPVAYHSSYLFFLPQFPSVYQILWFSSFALLII